LLSSQSDADLKALTKEAIALKQKEEQQSKQMEEKKMTVSNKIEQYCQEKKWRLGKRN
jgi:hypothetical protein